MERAMTDYLPGYDAWKTTNPDDEFLGPEPEDKDEIPEPEVEEVWDGARGEYVHTVTFASGAKYTIVQATRGRFVGDYEIHGPGGVFMDGYESPEKAIEWLCDPERRDW
jgi:hypothetical protein